MTIKTLICLSLLALGCAAPMWAEEAPAEEEIPGLKPGDPYYTLRSYYFSCDPGVLVRIEGATGYDGKPHPCLGSVAVGKVLYADPSCNIPVGSLVFVGDPEDHEDEYYRIYEEWGRTYPSQAGTKWMVLHGPVRPLGEGVYSFARDNLDHVDGDWLLAYDGSDTPESWRKVGDIIRQDMAGADPAAIVPAVAAPREKYPKIRFIPLGAPIGGKYDDAAIRAHVETVAARAGDAPAILIKCERTRLDTAGDTLGLLREGKVVLSTGGAKVPVGATVLLNTPAGEKAPAYRVRNVYPTWVLLTSPDEKLAPVYGDTGVFEGKVDATCYVEGEELVRCRGGLPAAWAGFLEYLDSIPEATWHRAPKPLRFRKTPKYWNWSDKDIVITPESEYSDARTLADYGEPVLSIPGEQAAVYADRDYRGPWPELALGAYRVFVKRKDSPDSYISSYYFTLRGDWESRIHPAGEGLQDERVDAVIPAADIPGGPEQTTLAFFRAPGVPMGYRSCENVRLTRGADGAYHGALYASSTPWLYEVYTVDPATGRSGGRIGTLITVSESGEGLATMWAPAGKDFLPEDAEWLKVENGFHIKDPFVFAEGTVVDIQCRLRECPFCYDIAIYRQGADGRKEPLSTFVFRDVGSACLAHYIVKVGDVIYFCNSERVPFCRCKIGK